MIDDNWELIDGDAAHAIEVLNYSNQVNVIEALVHYLMYHHCGEDGTCSTPPTVNVLQEFHRTATLFLLSRPGFFRQIEVVVGAGDVIIHTPPQHHEVEGFLVGFFEKLAANWNAVSAQEVGAYCLWMINWVHPFPNGNGRSARAFCYAALCLKLGFVLPGEKTVIDLIMEQREEYQVALKQADIGYDATGEPDLGPMTEFVDRLLAQQLSSIPIGAEGGA